MRGDKNTLQEQEREGRGKRENEREKKRNVEKKRQKIREKMIKKTESKKWGFTKRLSGTQLKWKKKREVGGGIPASFLIYLFYPLFTSDFRFFSFLFLFFFFPFSS